MPDSRVAVILVAEDDPSVRRVATTILRRAGYEVLPASGPREALGVAEQHPGAIDLLLTDVVMPVMSGKELAQRLSATRPELLVLYMSGCTDKASVHQGVLDAGVHLLPKPITPDLLLSAVAELFRAAHPEPAGPESALA
jgi:two-component system cell cycle sensor histidine kinase/response regulator CckA